VIGRQLVPLLVSAGHEVTGMASSGDRVQRVRSLGAGATVADLLDRDAVHRAVRNLAPDAVVHMATAIPAELNPRRLARDFATTNRLRTEGARNLLDAADEIGVRRVITQGVAYAYDPGGRGLATEDDEFWQNPPAQFSPVLHALMELERRTAQSGGLVLRLGHLYGPGSIYGSDGSFVRQVRAGKVPLVGGGGATFSFTHAHDAATAVLAALDKGVDGAINVVDDEPAAMSTWLPFLADLLGARRPKSAPAAMARLAVGGWGVAYMTKLRGADNTRAKLALDWKPRFASWRTGFADLQSAGDAARSWRE
jgi:nucleoside-diphosphate-sugar epimerase